VADEALTPVFGRLREIFAPHIPPLVVTNDAPGNYSLDAPRPDVPAPRRYFGGVRLTKNYVSFYLMPVYAQSALQDAISPALRKRMQGKSCFNFVGVDEPLFQELTQLTARSAGDFRMYDVAPGHRKRRKSQRRNG
jgi:hypothetical protein